jgi:uncharacterized membrane protein YphA (DoxX/SURF4 family)
MNRGRHFYKPAVFSLAFLWIFTGLTSIFFSPDVGYQILAGASITGWLADVAVIGGGLLDIVLGIWLMIGVRVRLCCHVQIAVITFYTLLLTIIEPSFWLHPFGPITKNFPIIVLILLIRSQENDR